MKEILRLFLAKNKFYLLGLYAIAAAWFTLQMIASGYSSSIHRLAGFTLAAFFLLKWNQRDTRPGEVSFLTTLIPTQKALITIHLLVPAALIYLPVSILSSDNGLKFAGLLIGLPLALILACIANLATKPLTQVLSFGLVYLILMDDGGKLTLPWLVAFILLYKALMELLVQRVSRPRMRLALAAALVLTLVLSSAFRTFAVDSAKSTVKVDGRVKTKNNFSFNTGDTNFKFNVNSDSKDEQEELTPLTPEELESTESILQVFRNKPASDYQDILKRLAASEVALTEDLVMPLEDLILVENPNRNESESACQGACQELANIIGSQWVTMESERLKERYQHWLSAPAKIQADYVLNVAIFAKLERHTGNWNDKPASQFFDSIKQDFFKIKDTLAGDKDYLKLAEEELNLAKSKSEKLPE